MLPPRHLLALALALSVASGLPASPASEDNHGHQPPSKAAASPLLPWIGGGAIAGALTGLTALVHRWNSRAAASIIRPPPPVDQRPNDDVGRRGPASTPALLKDPYNPPDLVSSRIPGRGPHLPYHARPQPFIGDPVFWVADQNIAQIVSRILTYEGDRRTSIRRWVDCMDRVCGSDWATGDYVNERMSWAEAHFLKAKEDECIEAVNEEIKHEAAGKATYFARTSYNPALHNPHHLETPNTPRRDPRLPYEHRPADYQGDALSYISRENEREIMFKLKTYDGRPAGPDFVMANYLEERLDPAQMERARDREDSCVDMVNRQLEADAHGQQKQASLPVRTYPPLDAPRQNLQQRQHPNEFSIGPVVAAWAHRTAGFKLMREAPKTVPAWEVDLVH
ncbi:MAG: hypothetical protein M1826_000672 [Phylliscum demangeonii]|nr:MAG: hypothetical protein M1826_000672 [Phylliscum demangeonii]